MVMSYECADNTGKYGSEIEVREGCDLANPFVIRKHSLDRGSPLEVIFPPQRTFWGSSRA
ncbi:MAG: hypothetical protein HYV59_15075 [Planctomycetes bacterium]|nr:hypothetical protein [Planctomycetota bacterium]